MRKSDIFTKSISVLMISIFIWTGNVYSFEYKEGTLRKPVGGDVLKRASDVLKKVTEIVIASRAVEANQSPLYNSMEESLEKLPSRILDKLKEMGLSDADIKRAEKLLGLVEKVYEKMDLLTKHYHNHGHNLMVTYAMLLLTKEPHISMENKKAVFIAGLFHDFHCRVNINPETGIGTAALVEETLRQLDDILELKPYKEPAVANARYSGKDSIINQKNKDELEKAIIDFLGGNREALIKAYIKITAMIRRSDFPSDVPMPHATYKQDGLNIREKIEEEIKKGTDIDEVIEMVEGRYRALFIGLEKDNIKQEEKNNSRIWLERQKGIEIAYLKALKKIKDFFEIQWAHELAHRLEKGADQAGLYYLCTPEMVEKVVEGLKAEVPAVSAAGSYPFFFSIELLTPEVLNILSNLPEGYKDNFCRVMGHFSKLSAETGAKMPDVVPVKPLFLNAENDWSQRSAKVALILGMSRTLLRQSLLGRLLTEKEIGILISKAELEIYEPGIKILKQGEAVGETGVYEILSGTIGVYIDNIRVASLKKGEIFGEMAVITKSKRNAAVVVEEEAIIAKIPPGIFSNFYSNNEAFNAYINNLIEFRVRDNRDKVNNHQKAINTQL